MAEVEVVGRSFARYPLIYYCYLPWIPPCPADVKIVWAVLQGFSSVVQ